MFNFNMEEALEYFEANHRMEAAAHRPATSTVATFAESAAFNLVSPRAVDKRFSW